MVGSLGVIGVARGEVSMRKKKGLTIDKLIELYEISNQAEVKSERTITWYRYILTAFSRYAQQKWGSNSISVFNIDNIRQYIIDLRNRKSFEGHPYTRVQDKSVSSNTVQGHVRGLKAFSSWIHAEGYTDENHLQNLKLPKVPVKVMEPLTPQEIEKVTASINKKSPIGARNYAIITTLLDTGMRASELAGITLGNLSLTDGYIKVMGKGSKERIVPIGKYVRHTLWDYIDRARSKPAGTDISNLFLTTYSKPISVNTVKLLFTRLAKISGVKRLHAHLCRNTFAINYLLNGGDIFSLREILGHTTLEMVNHYLHFTSSQITTQHHKYSPMDKLHGESV